MSGIKRYTMILALFTEVKSRWTVQEVSSALDVPSSTAYRTIRELTQVNMLEPAPGSSYRLGPAFIEFDRTTRLTDPLVQAGVPMLAEIARHANVPCVVVLARLYGNTVMCIADTSSERNTVQTSYERGLPRPLTRGATSKVILAQLPTRRLNKLLATAEKSDALAPTDNGAKFRNELSAIRKNGYCIARGEVDLGRVGIAVPIAVPEHGLHASLSLVLDAASTTDEIERRMVLLLISSASMIRDQI